MARIRSLKPTLWASEKLGRMSVMARLNFIGLISLADDEGRGRGTTRFLLGQLHPYADNISEQEFLTSLMELEAENLVAFYTVERARYYALPGWRDHQYIEKWRRSELPGVPADHRLAPLFAPRLRGDKEGNGSPPPIPGKGMEGNGREGKGLKEPAAPSDLSTYRLHIGEFKGIYVTSLPLNTAKRLLKEAKPGGIERRAIEWWIEQKESERTPAQQAVYGAKA